MRALLSALLLTALPVCAQDRAGGERLQRFQDYLERSPYHEKVFRGLVEAARAEGALEGLVEEYRARVRAGDTAAAAHVLLARLLAEEERFVEAAEHLRAVAPPTAETLRLMALMHSRAGQLGEATRTLTQALDLAEAPELLRDLQLERADLFLARGLEGDARDAYRAIADMAGGNVADLTDVAGWMADAGFAADGVALLEELLPTVEGDTPRTTQLLAQLGDLRERARDGRGALAAYEQALPMLRQGHWMRRDLLARSLDLHRRAGSLDGAIASYRVALITTPGDLETRLALVQALTLARRERSAREVLATGILIYPDDMRLSDQLIAALRAAGDGDGVVRELQRALEREPRDQRRRFDLGRALAGLGRLDGAHREWTRLLDSAAGDPALADRVAREWAQQGEVERAADVLRVAIERDPGTVRRYGDLARLLAAEGRAEAARQVLGRAERAVSARPGELDELAELYLEHHDPRSARRALQLAHDLDPRNSIRLGRLADANQQLGDPVRTGQVLYQWVEQARDETQREAACDRYARLFAGTARAAEVARLAQLMADGRTTARAPFLLRAHFHRVARAHEQAASVLDAYLQRFPEDVTARAQLARDLVRCGMAAEALAQYEELIARDPRRTAAYLLDGVRLLAAKVGHAPETRERLARLRQLPPNDPETWREVARSYLRIGLEGDAADCLAQALRLEPEDGRAHHDLATLLRGLGRHDKAAERFRLAWRHGDDEVRDRAVAGLHGMLAESQDLHREVRRLRATARRDPFDTETPRLLVELALRQEDAGEAVRVLTNLLRREGDSLDLLRRRAEAYAALGRSASALSDLRALVALGQDIDHMVVQMTQPLVASGDLSRALELGYLMREPMPLARQLQSADRGRSAANFLVRHQRKNAGLSSPAQLYLAELHNLLGERRQALSVLEEHEEEFGPEWHVTQRIGDLHHLLKDSRRAVEAGRRMLAQGAPDGALEVYFQEKASRTELTRLRTRELLTQADDAARIEAGFRELSRNLYDAPEALQLLDKLRDRAARSGDYPEGTTLGPWLQHLNGWTLRFYAANPRLVVPRLEELARQRYVLDADEWVEALWLTYLVPGSERNPMLADRPGTRAAVAARTTLGERAIERFPDSPKVLAAAARWAREEGDDVLALRAGRDLLTRLATPEELTRQEGVRSQVLARSAIALLPELPPHPDLGAGSPLALRLARLTYLPAPGPSGGVLVPDLRMAGAYRASDLVAAGRAAEGRQVLDALPAPHEEALLERVALVRARIEAGATEQVLEDLGQVIATRDRLAETPPLDVFLGWQAAVDAALAETMLTWLWQRARSLA
jgi:tetratricopeptide (TPR) repeat protein